jgi:hypothetical protein
MRVLENLQAIIFLVLNGDDYFETTFVEKKSDYGGLENQKYKDSNVFTILSLKRESVYLQTNGDIASFVF